MKKKVLLVLLTASVIATVTGCGKKNKKNESENQPVAETVQETETKTEEVEDTVEEVVDPKAIYEAFIAGDEPVYLDKFIDQCEAEYFDMEYVTFEKNTPYKLPEFVEAVVENLHIAEYGEYSLDEVQYAYIDCGMDQVPELAIYFPDIMETGVDSPAIYVIKEINGKLQVCLQLRYGYRTYANIDTYGLINTGGSGGADIECVSKEFVDANGDHQILYQCEYCFGGYGFYVPNGVSPYELAEEYGVIDNIAVEGYDFGPTGSRDYDDIIADRVYTYYKTDQHGNEIDDPTIYQKGNDYYQFMSDLGVNFVTPDEINKMIENRKKEIGYTEKLEHGNLPDWKTFYHANIAGEAEYVDNCIYSVVENPGWDYYSEVDYDSEKLPISLKQISKESNNVTDDYEWLDSIGKAGFVPNYCEDDCYYYVLSGDFEYEPYIIDIYTQGDGEHIAHLDMSEFTIPEKIKSGDEGFVFEAVNYVKYSDGLFYVSIGHRTYAESAPQNAYIMALDPEKDFAVRWKSQPLVSNARNFEIIDNTIVCGYGFTREPDFIYLLDKHCGVQVDVYPVKTGPDYIYEVDGKLYVRTYDTNYVYQINFG